MSGFARPVSHASSAHGIWLLRIIILIGFVALASYYRWWLGDRMRFILLLPIALWTVPQLAGEWTLYLASSRRRSPPHAGDCAPTVDVFVTAFNEPYALVERSLRAACAMTGAHATWLLDDGDDPALERLAAALGAGYLTRDGLRDGKAGNVNAALARTEGEIVAIFDADHAPAPNFLERTIGYFADPHVGFVQVMLTFCNGHESWVAGAGEESSRDFYNPTTIGADRLGGATMIGSNALIRREALASCGVYRPGMTEDLSTSLALHAAGWQSVYVAEPLAPGLSPPDLEAWFTQQLKWARGVFEALLREYPRAFPRLTWGQRLSYAVRITHYWIGLVVALHLVFTMIALFVPGTALAVMLHDYLAHLAPLAVAAIVIRCTALRVTRHPGTPPTSFLRSIILVYVTWPLYFVAWGMTVLRRRLAFRLTPKAPTGGAAARGWLAWQIATVSVLAVGLARYLIASGGHRDARIIGFALAQCIPPVTLLWLTIRQIPKSDRRNLSTEADRHPLPSPLLYD